jgi:hypothetical protein
MTRHLPILLALSALAIAQQPPAKFTNLQVLPQTIPNPELIAMMRQFTFALGVRCEHCHSKDFAADDKEAKRAARVMIHMVDSINKDFLAKRDAVECMTCHRGLTQPRSLKTVLSESLDKNGIPATVALYREMRKDKLASGEYDFSERTFNLLSETLLKQQKTKEAVAMMELNQEVNSPLTAWARSVIAMSHQSNGDTEKAVADFKKILELRPDDSWAKQQLEALQKK